MTYQEVDPRFGDWEDVKALGAEYDLQMECMVNHISPASKEFQDYLAKGDESEFRDLFIDWNKLWGGGPVKQIVCKAVASSGLAGTAFQHCLLLPLSCK